MCKGSPYTVTLICPSSKKRYLAYRCLTCGCQMMRTKAGTYEHTHDRILDSEIVRNPAD